MAAGGWIGSSVSRTRPGAPLGVVEKHSEERMLRRPYLPLVAALMASGVSLHAQEPVVGASDPEAVFHSSDPKLDANKQAAYHIVRDLLEAGARGVSGKDLTERELPHKPHAAAGRAVARCDWPAAPPTSPRSSAAAALARISAIQAGLIVLMVFAATALARGFFF